MQSARNLEFSAAQMRMHESIATIGASAWNACYPDELENYGYLHACENSGIEGFSWRYVTIEENGIVIAAIPAFFTDYALDTTLEGAPKRIVAAIRRYFPRFLMLKLACFGSPLTECGYAGFHPSVADHRKGELLRQLLAGFTQAATQQGYRLTGVKDVPERQKTLWDKMPELTAISSLATATLDIDFASVDEYLGRLSGETRKDMRRKLKAMAHIRVEERRNIDDVLPQVFSLYLQTKARSEFQFEELTATYFSQMLAQMKENASCTLYYADDKLLAANLLLKNKQILLDKFFCMDGTEGRKYNLYFLSWMTNVQYCLDHRIPCYQPGQAGDKTKRRLGCRMSPNRLMFMHASKPMNALLRLLAPLLAID